MAHEQKEVKVSIEFTPGHEQRFTAAVLKVYGNRVREERRNERQQAAAV